MNTPIEACGSRAVRAAAVVALVHVAQWLYLGWVVAHLHQCCDATDYYLPAGHSLLVDGLLWNDPYAGYRFYFVPLFFGLIEHLLGVFSAPEQIPTLMPAALACIFAVVSLLVSITVARTQGLRRWASCAAPLLFNPFVITIVPYALQESVIVTAAVPILVLILAGRGMDIRRTSLLTALFLGIVVASRSSLLWMAVPCAALLATRMRRAPRRHAVQGFVIATTVVAALLTPQSYIAWHRFGTLNPFTSTNVAHTQIAYGIEMLTYATVYDDVGFAPFPVWSPYRDLAPAEKNLSFYSKRPSEGLFLAAVHVWSGITYIAVTPYVPKSGLSVVSAWLVSSALIGALGWLGLPRLFAHDDQRDLALFVALVVMLSCAYTALPATEARFGLFGFAGLSFAAWHLVADPRERQHLLQTIPLVAGYVVLCVIINALLLYRVSLSLPVP